jgi:putative ABC transport system permease protein
LLALGLAGAALYELVARGAGPVEGSDGAPQIDRLLLLFPILAIAGVSGLAARGLRRLLARSRGAGAHWPPAAYLAARRLSSFSRLTGVLVTSCAAALGTLLFSALLSTSIQATADQRAFVTVGSEVAVHTTVPPPDLREAPFDATPVVRISDTSVEPGADGSVDVLGIDPATFERGAGWDERYASAPLDELVARLGPGDGSRLPVLIAGEGLPGDELLLADLEVPVEVVGRARVWPGMVGERPVVVAASNALDAALETAGSSVRRSADGYEVWAQAPASEVVAALRREGVDPVRTVSAAEVRSTPAYLALSWMFGFLQSLGLAAGVVALVGAHLFLHSRQREAETSYALARRMGLRAAEHRASVALELGGMLLASLLIGAVAAYATAAAVLGRIDLGAGAGPIPLLRIPAPLVAGVAVVLALFTAVAAWAVQRRADRTNVAQVMRYAD